ncbi:hypothetical protein [uncultured Roseobacter sp.]|uniref:hypothetical protein n=1 Tax=uncultured Roseobacter sp. TaxID=114847 RepID=UPI00262CED84|nr:hypothetical protein [uncultured Roseobacter sp.]
MAAPRPDPLPRLAASFDAYLTAVQDPALPERVRDHDLRHMAFWHAYYADTLTAFASGQTPEVLSGTYKVINRNAQRAHAEAGVEALLPRLQTAQGTVLAAAAQVPAQTLIPYKKGSRPYARDAYIGVVAEHFDMHVRYLHGIAKGAPEDTWVFHI